MANIRLSNGTCTAEVQLRGAQMASFKGPDGREVIWQADPGVWAQHAPVLFPVCGSVAPEGIRIDGTMYPMTKHGFTRNPDFTVVKQGDDFVELALTPTEESKPMYPFDFVFHVTYTLLENGYTTTFTVENKSDKVMPFCVGGHPGFCVPMEEGAAFTDYQLVFPQVEEGKNRLAPGGGRIDGYEYLDCFHNSDTLPLSYDLFDQRDALIFTELKSRSVKLVHKVSGKGIAFSFPKMEVLAVWTMPNKHAPYLCLEPWHGMPGEVGESGNFEDKPFVTMLAPGRSWQGSFTTTLID
ncbi:MAG: aldose 1-epimerase family protein [Eubacteriales bacterium]|nr:aldose 1-epimerase family protein [Eubacteriales bacterium]